MAVTPFLNMSEIVLRPSIDNDTEKSIGWKIMTSAKGYNYYIGRSYDLDKSYAGSEVEDVVFEITEMPQSTVEVYNQEEALFNVTFTAEVPSDANHANFEANYVYVHVNDLTMSKDTYWESIETFMIRDTENSKSIGPNVTVNVEREITRNSLVVNISTRFLSFNAAEHFGEYCFLSMTGIPNLPRSLITFGACMTVSPAEHHLLRSLLDPKVKIGTCSNQHHVSTRRTFALYEDSPECVTCSTSGFRNPEVLLYKRKQGSGRELLSGQPWAQSTYFTQVAYTLPAAAEANGVEYTCIAFTDDAIDMSSSTAVLTEPLKVTFEDDKGNYQVVYFFHSDPNHDV